jgi:hypothetical protein
MRWLSFVPGKSTLLVLFGAAKRRVATQTDGADQLSDERLGSATEELNQIADDVRDAQADPDTRVPSAPAPTVERRHEPQGRRRGDH